MGHQTASYAIYNRPVRERVGDAALGVPHKRYNAGFTGRPVCDPYNRVLEHI